MAETLSYDPSSDPEVLASIESDEAESLAIGEEMINQANERLAGKYKNAQELERAYMELEKKLGSKSNEPSEESSETEEPEEKTERASDDAQIEAISRAAAEWNEKGELTPETLAAFESMSSKELVEAYFRYEQNFTEAESSSQSVEISQADINRIQNSVGGEAAYKQLVSWAADNFSQSEIDAFDNVVDSGNVDAINLALAGLKARYTDAVGYEGKMIQGKAAAPADTFKSQAEVVRAMSDPKYDRDPAYRDEIMQKLARSDLKF
jgi:hypothetical protein